jgi:hypothetical protein
MTRLRLPEASAFWMAGQLSLLAVSIAIWKPQPIHILELYQIEGNSQCVQALQGLGAGERGQPLRHLQKHLQQISPHTVIHRMKVRVTDQKSVRPKKEELQAILAIEADGRLQPQRLEDALRGWNASTVAPSEKDSPDPLADKQKRWATWKRDIAQHQLMLLATSVDRPEVRKIASSASLASFETSGGSADQAVSTASPEQQWRHLLEEASMQLPAMSPTATNFATPSTSEAFVCRSAGCWLPRPPPSFYGPPAAVSWNLAGGERLEVESHGPDRSNRWDCFRLADWNPSKSPPTNCQLKNGTWATRRDGGWRQFTMLFHFCSSPRQSSTQLGDGSFSPSPSRHSRRCWNGGEPNEQGRRIHPLLSFALTPTCRIDQLRIVSIQ